MDAAHDGHDEDHVDPGGVQILDGAELHVEEVADLAVRVGLLAHPVELQIGDAQARLLRGARVLGVLRERDAIGRALHAEVTDTLGVFDRAQEVRRQGRLSPGELDAHLPARLHTERLIEDLLDLLPRELVDEPHLVCVHEARVAHHVAAIREIDGEDSAPTVFDGRSTVVTKLAGGGGVVAARKEPLDAGAEGEVHREHVVELPVLRARLGHHEPAGLRVDASADLSRLALHQGPHLGVSVEDRRAHFFDASGAK